MATKKNENMTFEQKVEQEAREAMDYDHFGHGWFKWNFVVYPSLFAFTFCLIVAQDLYKLADWMVTLAITPFVIAYAVATGKWIEESVVDENESEETLYVSDVDAGTQRGEIDKVEEEDPRVDGLESDTVDKIEEPEQKVDPEENDEFVEIDID